jgi:predicted metal-dependent TIM-barrel fold hydrolase
MKKLAATTVLVVLVANFPGRAGATNYHVYKWQSVCRAEQKRCQCDGASPFVCCGVAQKCVCTSGLARCR